jgi:hypothetical protein
LGAKVSHGNDQKISLKKITKKEKNSEHVQQHSRANIKTGRLFQFLLATSAEGNL